MEKKVKRKRNRILSAGVVFILCACTLAQATMLYVQDMTLTMPLPTTFYTYSSGSGNLILSTATCGVTVTFVESSNYSITNGQISISSALVNDTSSGVLAIGDFQGGRILTLTGKIKYKPTNTIFYTGTIFAANMEIGSDETWVLQELSASPITIDGSVEFLSGTTGLGGSGITYGSDTLKIGNFRADFSFKSVSPNPTVFDTTQTLSGTASTIQITATTPEPATITLFTIAALAFRINKKK